MYMKYLNIVYGCSDENEMILSFKDMKYENSLNRCSNERGENMDWENRKEISQGRGRVEITWLLI